MPLTASATGPAFDNEATTAATTAVARRDFLVRLFHPQLYDKKLLRRRVERCCALLYEEQWKHAAEEMKHAPDNQNTAMQMMGCSEPLTMLLLDERFSNSEKVTIAEMMAKVGGLHFYSHMRCSQSSSKPKGVDLEKEVNKREGDEEEVKEVEKTARQTTRTSAWQAAACHLYCVSGKPREMRDACEALFASPLVKTPIGTLLAMWPSALLFVLETDHEADGVDPLTRSVIEEVLRTVANKTDPHAILEAMAGPIETCMLRIVQFVYSASAPPPPPLRLPPPSGTFFAPQPPALPSLPPFAVAPWKGDDEDDDDYLSADAFFSNAANKMTMAGRCDQFPYD